MAATFLIGWDCGSEVGGDRRWWPPEAEPLPAAVLPQVLHLCRRANRSSTWPAVCFRSPRGRSGFSSYSHQCFPPAVAVVTGPVFAGLRSAASQLLGRGGPGSACGRSGPAGAGEPLPLSWICSQPLGPSRCCGQWVSLKVKDDKKALGTRSRGVAFVLRPIVTT